MLYTTIISAIPSPLRTTSLSQLICLYQSLQRSASYNSCILLQLNQSTQSTTTIIINSSSKCILFVQVRIYLNKRQYLLSQALIKANMLAVGIIQYSSSASTSIGTSTFFQIYQRQRISSTIQSNSQCSSYILYNLDLQLAKLMYTYVLLQRQLIR